jgi:putative salt-induced outer membrane protein YdiY
MRVRRLDAMPAIRAAMALACLTLGGGLGVAAAEDTCPCPPPPPPPPHWTGSVGAGLALAGGNSDSRSFNASAALKYDPQRSNVFRAEALYLRTDQEGVTGLDRTWALARDEYKVAQHFYAFGELTYSRDRFKDLDYLWAPTAGVGYRVVDSPSLLLAVDSGAGGFIEKLTGASGTADFALRASQRLEWKASPRLRLFEQASGLWKTGDFGDAYYRIVLGGAVSLSRRLELSATLTNDQKTRPPAGLGKSDTSFVSAVVFKIG